MMSGLAGALTGVPANSRSIACVRSLMPPAALAECDPGQAVDVADAAVRQQHRADIGDAAEYPARAEGAVEPLQMDEAVEQRQYGGVGPDAGADRLDRGVEIVMLRGQQHDVVGAADPVGGRDLDRHREIAERAFDLEAVLGERGGARTAHQKRDVAPGLGQTPAEIAADRTGPEHQETHFNILVCNGSAGVRTPAIRRLSTAVAASSRRWRRRIRPKVRRSAP